jgi:hemerythrin-like domain-containing protein
MAKATQELKKEHDVILVALGFLEKMICEKSMEDKVRHYDEMVYFLKVFADLYHHKKEEFLFHDLSQQEAFKEKELIGVLLKEHELDRRYITYMNESLETRDYEGYGSAATKYCNLVQRHIKTENDVLFVIADELLDESKQEELFDRFLNYEYSAIGDGISNELNLMICTWTKEFENT